MPEYLSPGVYIEELPGPQPIQGVSTSTTGMVGVTQKGPTTGKPVLVTSFAEFRAQFGSFLAEPDDAERLSWELDDQEGGFWWRFPNAVKGFFDNGGRRLFVKRVVSSQATAAEVEIPSSVVAARPGDVRTDPLLLEPPAGPGPAPAALLRAVAKARGAWGKDISVRVRPGRARRIQAVHESGTGPIATTLAAELPREGNSAVIRWTGRLEDVAGPVVVLIAGERFTVANVPPPANGRATLTLDHPSPTRWLSGTAVKILRVVDDGAAAPGPVTVPLARTSDEAVYRGALVMVGQGEARATVTEVVAPSAPPPQGPRPPGSVRLTAVAGGAIPRVFETDLVVVVEAVVDVRYEAGASNPADQREEPEVTTETFSGLRLHPALRGHPRSLVDVVNTESNLVSLQVIETDQMPAVTWDLFPGRRSDEEDGELPLENGGDALDDLSPLDFVGEDLGSGRRSGIQALEDIEEISICVVPGMWSRTVQGALLAHCERLKDRFAVLDAQRGLGVQGVQAFREPLDSAYAALYHPWLRVRDPVTAHDVPVPPSGHVAGLYALTDVERGVHKAPANVVIQQIADLDDDINQREQDLLNPVGINALREFPNRGRRVWGARTLSSIPEWRYVNVRRLFLFIEDSIKQGTQWVVFEPNGEPLWALVVQAVTNFLDTVWRTGALQGLRQEEAFYVRADRSTMTQDDIDNGRLVVEIGIAPVRPAEFVIFRFRQKTREQVAVA